MKGKIKVEIIKPNGETTVVEKENVVTDAHKNIIKGFCNYWHNMFNNGIVTLSNGKNLIGNLNKFPTDLVHSLFGGLLVFNDNLNDDNAQHILPTADDISKYVGCANSAQSAYGTMKGTFNTVESEFTDSYAKFVWNFTASELYNEDIGAFALTSELGGQTGLGFDNFDSNIRGKGLMEVIADMWDLSTNQQVGNTNLNGCLSGLSVSQSNNNSRALWYDAEHNKLIFGRYYRGTILKRELDLSKFTINEISNGNFGKTDGTKETTLSVTSVTQTDAWIQVKGFTNNFYVSTRNPISNASITFTKFNMLDGTETSLGTFSQDFRTAVRNIDSTIARTPQCIVEEGGVPYMYVYAANSAHDTIRIWKYNMSTGTFTYADTALSANAQTLLIASFPSTPNAGFYYIDGSLYITSFGSVVSASGRYAYNLFRVKPDLTIEQYPELQVEGSTVYLENLVSIPALLPKPWLFQAYYGNYVTICKPFIFTPYLGTIANLDAVLTKPADATMKVTYTLYNGNGGN